MMWPDDDQDPTRVLETQGTQAHSLLPWRVGKSNLADRAVVMSADDYYVTTPAFAPSDHGTGVTEETNAAFIVTACNAHHELLAALKALIESDDINIWLGGNPNVVNRVLAQAQDAIAKAEGATHVPA